MFGKSSDSRLRFLLSKYQKRLEELQLSFTSEQILNILLLRDAIQTTLESLDNWEGCLLQQLSDYDQELQQYQKEIVQLPEYHQWKKIRNPSHDYWWWHWELQNHKIGWQKLLKDLSNLFILICWGFSLSLIIDAVPRILSGGLDQFSALSILIPSFLALLTSGKLTPITENLFNSIFSNSENKKIFVGVLSLLLAIGLVIIHENYNQLSSYFNTVGKNNYDNNKLAQALSNYNRAIAFNPDHGEAHYNLGILYEDLQELDKAKTEYKIAGKQGDLLTRLNSYNNLGRIYLLNKKYQDAIFPLLEANNDFDENTVNSNIDFQKTKYALDTNLGWANWGLTNYKIATSLLLSAKSFYEKHLDKLDQLRDQEKHYKRKGKAYCLLAQVYEGEKRGEKALEYWNSCITYGNIRYPEEYIWVNMAKEKIQ